MAQTEQQIEAYAAALEDEARQIAQALAVARRLEQVDRIASLEQRTLSVAAEIKRVAAKPAKKGAK